jgi:hypothetical protein
MWFFQTLPNEFRLGHCYINNELDFNFYLDYIEDMPHEPGVRDIYLPHDGKSKTLQTGRSIVECCLRRGIRPRIVPDMKLRDSIQAARHILPYCTFNIEPTGPNCANGIEGLKSYRRAWDEDLHCYRDRPVHDWASDIADSFRYFATVSTNQIPRVGPRSREAVTPGGVIVPANYAFNLEDLHEHCGPVREETWP